MSWYVEPEFETYRKARAGFEWDIPENYNAAWDLLRKHEETDRAALYQKYPNGEEKTYTFRELDEHSNEIANALAARGIEFGDRVAVVLPQKPENPITHLACWKLGAVSLPLSVLFGPDALKYRLQDSSAKAIIADVSMLDTIESVRDECPALEHVITVDADDPAANGERFEKVRTEQSSEFEIAETNAETPAIVMYTSGSTGEPKGVVHSHTVWVGHCPAFYMYFEKDVFDSVYWTPADWAWIGALGDVVFPAWHYGQPVVGYPMGEFDSEEAFEIVERFAVTNAFLPPTAIRMMMSVENPATQYDLTLDAICSGGEPLTPEILDWAANELDGVPINEIYGQTEANLLVTNCQKWFSGQAGSIGKPVPGHRVAIIDKETGKQRDEGEIGMIAVERTDDPVVFKEYLNQPRKTEAVTVEGPEGTEWHLTEDLGYYDADGYFWFKSRDDDVIITSGYRVGPGEVERSILEHPDVEQVGVIGVADDMRGEIIKAFVQPVSGVEGGEKLKEEIQSLVKGQLAKYEYPREIAFVEELPTTTTGKIQRRKLHNRK